MKGDKLCLGGGFQLEAKEKLKDLFGFVQVVYEKEITEIIGLNF